MRIVLTGSSGRLGRACVPVLRQAGHTVVGLDAVPAPDLPIATCVASLLDPFAIHRAIAMLPDGRADAIVHLANHTSGRVAPPEVVLRENLSMNSSVFMGALLGGCSRLVFASSVQAVLGGTDADLGGSVNLPASLPIDESTPPCPTNTYGLSKLLSEQALNDLCRPELFGRPFTAFSLRLPYILGPKGFENAVLREGKADFAWGGAECFCYIHIDDAAEAVSAAIAAPGTGHQVLWVSAPDPRVPEAVGELAERFYAAVPGIQEAVRAGSFVRLDKARTMLNWQPRWVASVERARRRAQP